MAEKFNLRAIVLTLAASGVLSMSNAAHAEPTLAPLHAAASGASKTSSAGQGSARFDWLAKRSSAKVPAKRVVQRVSLGRGSWVCSPAGFNRKSRCARR